MKKILLFGAFTALLVSFSHSGGGSGKKGLHKGEEVKVHAGKAWTWAKISKKGTPENIGITLTDEALNSVPMGSGNMGHGHGGGQHDYWIVKFSPVTGTIIPFNFVLMNWNPNGHPPEKIYDKPHFDFHFYSSTPEEVRE